MVVSTVLTGLTSTLSRWTAESGVGCICGGCGVAVPEGRADADGQGRGREIQHRKLEVTEAREGRGPVPPPRDSDNVRASAVKSRQWQLWQSNFKEVRLRVPHRYPVL
jgi:hypothetical protein